VGAAALFTLLFAEFAANLLPADQAMRALDPASKPVETLLSAGPAWYYYALALLGLAAGAAIIAVGISLFVVGVRKRSASTGESPGRALLGVLTRARRQSGGYVAHIGIGVMLIGLVGSGMFVYDNTYSLAGQRGASFQVSDYTFAYLDSSDRTQPNGDGVLTLDLDVRRAGRPATRLTLRETVDAQTNEARTDAHVLWEPLRDVFCSLQGLDNGSVFVVNVKVNPLISFTWAGLGLLLAGAGLATWPERRRRVAA
jgi:cytochrome c-type biogenesis protein CcmF